MNKENPSAEKKQPTTDEMKELASQLANPRGEKGIDIGHMMNETNITLTRNAIRHLHLKHNDVVLELGHGNGNHLAELHQQASVTYQGLDISSTMKDEAEKYVLKNGLAAKSSFKLYDGTNIPFADHTFDKIFTVNTIYFWQNPNELLGELYRILKPNGLLCILFVDKSNMDVLPFTAYGFTKYTANSFEAFIKPSRFEIISLEQHTEKIKSKVLGEMDRMYFVAVMGKD